MPQNKNTQSGNVFIIILVAVFLFGALMFTFSRSGSQSVSTMSKQEAKIAAQEILNYARLVEGAVDRVRRNGCSESEISFENSTVAGYTNANAPVDKSCHIFEPEAGKIEYHQPNTEWLNNNYSAALLSGGSYGQYRFQGGISHEDMGTNNPELVVYLNFLNKEICTKINNLLGVNNLSGDTATDIRSNPSVTLFDGNYGTPLADKLGDDTNGYLTSKTTACYKETSNLVYQFYHVLLAR